MSNKILTFPQIEKDIIEADYKAVALCDKHGKILIPWNNRNMKLPIRLGEIKKRLASAATLPGVYQIHAKSWDTKTPSEPAVYLVGVGTEAQYMKSITLEDPNLPARQNTAVAEQGAISFDEYKAMYLENLELTATVNRLSRELEDVETQLDAALDQLDEVPENSGGLLSDGNKEFVKGLAEQAIPLIDKILQQQDHKLKQRDVELNYLVNGGNPGATKPGTKFRAAPKAEQENEEEEEEEDLLTDEQEFQISSFEHMKQHQPELYAQMMENLKNYNAGE